MSAPHRHDADAADAAVRLIRAVGKRVAEADRDGHVPGEMAFSCYRSTSAALACSTPPSS